jgi:hypothetical protein
LFFIFFILPSFIYSLSPFEGVAFLNARRRRDKTFEKKKKPVPGSFLIIVIQQRMTSPGQSETHPWNKYKYNIF